MRSQEEIDEQERVLSETNAEDVFVDSIAELIFEQLCAPQKQSCEQR